MLRPAVTALALMALVVLASAALYYHSKHDLAGTSPLVNTQQDTEHEPDTSISGWYDNVVLRVSYTVIDDPGVLSIAREFIKKRLPHPADMYRDEERVIDWARADIAVLKVVVELTNNGDEPVYYVTNAYCEVPSNTSTLSDRFKPITWRVENPITLPRIIAEEGQVFPLVVSCTLDLGYREIPPKTGLANEYYYIVTKPFKGTIKAVAIICAKLLSSECETIENHTYVDIVGESTVTPVDSVVGRQNDLRPWIINDYGDLIVVKVNRPMFRNLGNGYYLLVLPDMKYNDFDDIALSQVAPYLCTEMPEALLYAVWNGSSYTVRVNETRGLGSDADKVWKGIGEFLKDVSSEDLAPEELKIFVKGDTAYVVVGGASKIVGSLARLAYQHLKGFSRRVIVIEKLGWLPPGGSYQRRDMLEALSKISCFFSFGEAVYGTSMILNITCVEELAKKNNETFDEALEHIAGEVRELDPLIRKYLPWQEILVVVVAKTPKPVVPVGMATASTSKPLLKSGTEATRTEESSQISTATPTKIGKTYSSPHQLATLLIVAAVGIVIVVTIVKHK